MKFGDSMFIQNIRVRKPRTNLFSLVLPTQRVKTATLPLRIVPEKGVVFSNTRGKTGKKSSFQISVNVWPFQIISDLVMSHVKK